VLWWPFGSKYGIEKWRWWLLKHHIRCMPRWLGGDHVRGMRRDEVLWWPFPYIHRGGKGWCLQKRHKSRHRLLSRVDNVRRRMHQVLWCKVHTHRSGKGRWFLERSERHRKARHRLFGTRRWLWWHKISKPNILIFPPPNHALDSRLCLSGVLEYMGGEILHPIICRVGTIAHRRWRRYLGGRDAVGGWHWLKLWRAVELVYPVTIWWGVGVNWVAASHGLA
jgi:hypothetical protein